MYIYYINMYEIYKNIYTMYIYYINMYEIYKNTLFMWEKAMAIHSSTLAWKIPRTKEPGGLQSMGPLRVGHD